MYYHYHGCYCDRCGAEAPTKESVPFCDEPQAYYEAVLYDYLHGYPYKFKRYHLCEECYKAVTNFMKGDDGK